MFSARKKHYYELSTASQGRPRGEGAKEAICPGPPVKGGPQICKRGAPKGVIKKIIIWNVFYINHDMREIF